MMQVEQTEINQVTDVGDAIRSRRTIHNFRPDPVDESLLLEAIEAARWAPNHKMTEPWRFYRLGPQSVSMLADLNVALFMAEKSDDFRAMKHRKWLNMPTATVVTSKVGTGAFREKEDYAATSCAIHNFSLYLWSKGVGVKWSTTKLTRAKEMYEALGIDPASEEIVGILWAGYPDEIPTRDRSPLESCVARLP